MIFIDGKILYIEETRHRFETIDYYSWLQNMYNACSGYSNYKSILDKYCHFVLKRKIKETFINDYYEYFGELAPISTMEYDDFFEILIDIA